MIQAERRVGRLEVGRLEVNRLEVDHPMCRLDRIRIRTRSQRIEDD